jgi:hypothetical protein
VRILETDVEVEKTAGVFALARVGVVGLVGEDANGGRGDAVGGEKRPDVG